MPESIQLLFAKSSIRFNFKLRIKRVNHRAMLILDEFAAHLQRGSQFAALDRELLIEQRDLLDLLVRRQVSGHFIDLLLEVFDDSRMARKLGVVFGFDAERYRV